MNILSGTLTLTHKETVARDTVLMRFATQLADSDDTPLPFAPGQFVSMEFGPKSWRAYSIASHPDEAEIELVVRLVEGGVASEVFRKSDLGTSFNFKGPFGHFLLTENHEATLNFCATGTGIAPLRAMILEESKKDKPRAMRLFYGGRDKDDIAYLNDLKTWAPDMEIFLGLSQSDASYPNAKKQRITAFLEAATFDNNDEFYLCGNGPMVKSVKSLLGEKGIEKTQIHQERFN